MFALTRNTPFLPPCRATEGIAQQNGDKPVSVLKVLWYIYTYKSNVTIFHFKMHEKRPKCAWQVATEPSASSFGLLDLNAYYHTLVIWEFADEDVYRISGTFPAMRSAESWKEIIYIMSLLAFSTHSCIRFKIDQVYICIHRYFSIQSYEFTNGKPIASMLDRNVVPKTGKNPHRDPTATAPEVSPFVQPTVSLYRKNHVFVLIPTYLPMYLYIRTYSEVHLRYT